MILQDTTWYYEVVRVVLRVALPIITRGGRWYYKVLRGTTSCNTSCYEHISGCNCLEMLFKIDALKNSEFFLVKRRILHRFFPVNGAKFLRTAFL